MINKEYWHLDKYLNIIGYYTSRKKMTKCIFTGSLTEQEAFKKA